MVQRAVHHEVQVFGESLSGNEIIGIGKDGLVAHHHALRTSRGARGVEHIGGALRAAVGGQLSIYTLKGILGHVAFQRGSDEFEAMEGKIVDEEVDGGGGAERVEGGVALVEGGVALVEGGRRREEGG